MGSDGRGWGGRRINLHTDTLEQLWPPGIATRHLPCRGEVQMLATVSDHGSPTGALQRYRSLYCDITGSAKNGLQKS